MAQKAPDDCNRDIWMKCEADERDKVTTDALDMLGPESQKFPRKIFWEHGLMCEINTENSINSNISNTIRQTDTHLRQTDTHLTASFPGQPG